jgi:hypothetical protein
MIGGKELTPATATANGMCGGGGGGGNKKKIHPRCCCCCFVMRFLDARSLVVWWELTADPMDFFPFSEIWHQLRAIIFGVPARLLVCSSSVDRLRLASCQHICSVCS